MAILPGSSLSEDPSSPPVLVVEVSACPLDDEVNNDPKLERCRNPQDQASHNASSRSSAAASCLSLRRPVMRLQPTTHRRIPRQPHSSDRMGAPHLMSMMAGKRTMSAYPSSRAHIGAQGRHKEASKPEAVPPPLLDTEEGAAEALAAERSAGFPALLPACENLRIPFEGVPSPSWELFPGPPPRPPALLLKPAANAALWIARAGEANTAEMRFSEPWPAMLGSCGMLSCGSVG